MPRYVYKPLDYSVWMRNYIDTLKSGEILVDFGTEFDIMVTENGLNIPIPVTKNLRNMVKEFLEDNLNTITLKESEINEEISTTQGLYNKIREAQVLMDNRIEYMYSKDLDVRARNIFLKDVSQKNINQIGDIDLQISSFPIDSLKKEMDYYANLFNSINNDSTFDGFIKNGSDDLIRIWSEIENMMKYSNEALDGFNSGNAHASYTQISTSEFSAYDIDYTNFLNNGPSNGTQSIAGFLNGEPGPFIYDETQFYAIHPSTSPIEMSRPPMETWTSYGFGFLYPYFPYKRSRHPVSANTSTTMTGDGHRMYSADPRYGIRSDWLHNFDIGEGVPLSEGQNGTNGFSSVPSSHYLVPIDRWATVGGGVWSSDGYRQKVFSRFEASLHGRSTPMDLAGNTLWYKNDYANVDYDRIVSRTKRDGLQRYPKWAVGGVGEINVGDSRTANGESFHTSTKWPRPFYSLGQVTPGDIPNTEIFMIRMGVEKRLVRTTIKTVNANGNINTNGELVNYVQNASNNVNQDVSPNP